MSIHFISGKPGGGKSLYSMKLIVEELVLGSRTIITNVPIRLGELNAYIQREYPDRLVDLVGRVWVLTDDQTGEFWTYRPNAVRIERLTKDQWREGHKPSYAAVSDHGVMYVIDEIHNFFGSRQWAETGQDVLFYLSQHRKLGDTVVCITQAVANVDKQFRSVTQDFTFLRNLSKEKYGFFRLPAYFVRKTFSSPPTDTTQPMETGTFTLDVRGLAACYDSAAGVGIHGRSADTMERKKGLHPAWFLVGLGVVIYLVFFLVPRAGAYAFSSRPPARLPSGSAPETAPAPRLERPAPVLGRQSARSGSAVVSSEPAKPAAVYIAGRSGLEGARRVVLTDGRGFAWGDARWTVDGVSYVVIEGQTFVWR